ncbi:unnamed protein product [Trichogramma brassicae]|uniref:Uncharacterized protein n=1 Tax=Trichogramma brassicae TaxID=86971 RepID=A0A6H5I2I6_9HYME|nr:unnamed protein product [Trichogramma brassicae]
MIDEYESLDAEIDESPLQPSMGRNKEFIKIKVALNVLELNSFKSPVSLHEQTKQQERRKTENMLKGPPNHQRIGGASNRSSTQSNETSYELLLRQTTTFSSVASRIQK